MLRSLLGGLSNSERGTATSGAPASSPDTSEYFKLSCQSPEQLAALLRARHGLGELGALYAAFRNDPGCEVHPERVRTSSDGFTVSATPRPTQIVESGYLIVERFDGGNSASDTYQRMRSFKSYSGALAEFCAKLEMCAVGSLEVSENNSRAGRAELRFEGINRTMQLMSVGG